MSCDVNKTATPKTQDKARTSPLKTKAKTSSPRPRQGQDTNQHDQEKTKSKTQQYQARSRQDSHQDADKNYCNSCIFPDVVATLVAILKIL